MSKFEVGQRVIVVTDVMDIPPNPEFFGKEGTIKQIGGTHFEVLVALDDAREPLWFDEDELEAVT